LHAVRVSISPAGTFPCACWRAFATMANVEDVSRQLAHLSAAVRSLQHALAEETRARRATCDELQARLAAITPDGAPATSEEVGEWNLAEVYASNEPSDGGLSEQEEQVVRGWCVKHYPQGDAACAKVLSDDVVEHPRHGAGKRLLVLRCRHRDILGCTFRMKVHRAEDGALMAYVKGKHEDHNVARELGKMSTLPHGATALVDRCFRHGMPLEHTLDVLRRECPHLLSSFEDRQLKAKVRNRRGYLVKKQRKTRKDDPPRANSSPATTKTNADT